jgi:hypothetical protein
MSTIVRTAALAAALGTIFAVLGGCATSSDRSATPSAPATTAAPATAAAPAAAASDGRWQAQAALPHRSLASFAKSNPNQACYDRNKEPYTPIVDAHFHPRPFGGQAIPPQELFGYFDKLGVRFVNYFGIGQSLDMRSACTYYLDCPGTSALPSIKNDFVNGSEVKVLPHPNLHITLSMTFMDLAHPKDIVKTIELYDKEFPGMFKWSGELNVVKQALVPNKHEPATIQSIDRWAPFMKVLRDRGIPVTLHMDLGSDAEPTKNVYLMKHILQKYPDNKIVWAHAGLSKELQHMDPTQHVSLMREAFKLSQNVLLDISWDVLYNAYHEFGPIFIAFFDEYPDRILPGSDFVAARNKSFDQYAKEFEITSRVLKSVSDEAFRRIALGENYFRLMNLDYRAPEICK